MPEIKKLNTKLLKDFQRAKEAAVPLLVIQTADQAATMKSIVQAYKDECPIIKWDVSDGLVAMNDKGAAGLQGVTLPMAADPPYEHIKVGLKFERYTIFFVLNGNLFMGSDTIDRAAFTQSIWNLRDKYKNINQERILVILCSDIQLPSQVKQDFILLDDPLPTSEELWKISESIYNAANVEIPKDEVVKEKVTQTLKGLSAFAAEQTLAMSITKKGMDLEKLWEQKRHQVEQTQGLSIYRGHESFQDVRGVPVVKEFLTRLFKGASSPTVIVFMDEIEKALSGIHGDNTGVSQEQHGELLKWMQDNEVLGMMLVGHPGCTKSFLAKACAGEFALPMVEMNISAMKGSLVGETGAATRTALRVISAIGKPIVLATSNSLGILPPELRRRFAAGTFFFDLPSSEERQAVWDLYLKKYNITTKNLPGDAGWTPAEIKNCCDLAWRLKCTPEEASKYIVPISQSMPDRIEALRLQAHQRFLSASNPGVYKHQKLNFVEDNIESLRGVALSGKVGEA